MKEEEKNDRGRVSQKFLEFQKSGLEAYIRYLESEKKNSKNVGGKESYNNYLVLEIERSKKRICVVDKKLLLITNELG